MSHSFELRLDALGIVLALYRKTKNKPDQWVTLTTLDAARQFAEGNGWLRVAAGSKTRLFLTRAGRRLAENGKFKDINWSGVEV